MPELRCFDLLNDKWRFGAMCHSLGVKHPRTWLVEGKASLLKAMSESGALSDHPQAPQHGRRQWRDVLAEETCESQIASIDYAPIILQDFIPGEDIGASVFCLKGRITGFVGHHFDEQVYTTFFDADILGEIEKIVAPLKLDGVFNFDMRRAPDGAIWWLECNPRFYSKMAMTMANGLKFVALGLTRREDGPDDPDLRGAQQALSPPQQTPLTARARPAGKFELISGDAMRFMVSDPVVYWQEYHYFNEDLAIQFYRGPQEAPAPPAPA